MARVKRGVTARARHNKVLGKAKGYYNARRKVYRAPSRRSSRPVSTPIAIGAPRSGSSAHCGSRASMPRRASTAQLQRMIDGLNRAGIEIDRKMLADLAVHDTDAFGAIANQAKTALGIAA